MTCVMKHWVAESYELLMIVLEGVDLLALTSLDQLLFTLKILFFFITKQATLTRRSMVLSLPVKLVFPGIADRTNPVKMILSNQNAPLLIQLVGRHSEFYVTIVTYSSKSLTDDVTISNKAFSITTHGITIKIRTLRINKPLQNNTRCFV
jgi:hypothetical protein